MNKLLIFVTIISLFHKCTNKEVSQNINSDYAIKEYRKATNLINDISIKILDSTASYQFGFKLYSLIPIYSSGSQATVIIDTSTSEVFILDQGQIFIQGRISCINDLYYIFDHQEFECDVLALKPAEIAVNRLEYFKTIELQVDDLDLLLNFNSLIGTRLKDLDKIKNKLSIIYECQVDQNYKKELLMFSSKLINLYQENKKILFYENGQNLFIIYINPYDRIFTSDQVKLQYGRYLYNLTSFYLKCQ